MKKKIFFNVIWTLSLYAIILFLVIFFNIKYDQKLQIATENKYSFERIAWIVIESIGMLLILCLFWISTITIKYDWINWKEKIIYSLITLNLYRFIYILIKAKKNNYLLSKWKKWKMIDYTLISLSVATYMILTVICKMLIPTIPQLFISLSLEYIALFFIAYITRSFTKTLLTSFICGMMLLLLPTTYFINFPQFMFDYLIPNLSVSLASLIIIDKKTNKSIFKWLSFIVIPYIFVYWSRVLAGIIFYGSFAWEGFPLLLYSMIINGLNTSVDFGVMVVVGPIILSRMWPLRIKYKSKWDN